MKTGNVRTPHDVMSNDWIPHCSVSVMVNTCCLCKSLWPGPLWAASWWHSRLGRGRVDRVWLSSKAERERWAQLPGSFLSLSVHLRMITSALWRPLVMFLQPQVLFSKEALYLCHLFLDFFEGVGRSWRSCDQRVVADLTLEERTCLNLLFSSCMLGDLGLARWRPPLLFSPLPPPSARITWRRERESRSVIIVTCCQDHIYNVTKSWFQLNQRSELRKINVRPF